MRVNTMEGIIGWVKSGQNGKVWKNLPEIRKSSKNVKLFGNVIKIKYYELILLCIN